MKKLTTLAAALCLSSLASAQMALEDFESGTFPPAGWTVIDNAGNGNVWQTSSYYPHGNLSGGTGECAVMDDDAVGPGQATDTELITPAFDIPTNEYFLDYDHTYQYIATDYGAVDISVGGGAWSTLTSYSFDVTEQESVYLGAYAGSTNVQVRFHYDDAGWWAWWWHVDNVEVRQGTPPPTPVWEERFDTGIFPPAGWTVVDNVGNGNVWSSNLAWSRGNVSGGTGECAAIDEDLIGPGQGTDTELISASFDIPSGPYYLQFTHNFVSYFEQGDLEISVGGGPWTLLGSWTVDSVGEVSIDLQDYVGSTGCQLRFHYDDLGQWGWYWYVDDVVVVEGDPPPTAIWEEDFDGGTFPPAGWTVIDNAGNGNVWAPTSTWTKGNQSGGTGEAAGIDDDEIGSGNRTDTELLTPSFLVPGSGLEFMYTHLFYDQYVAEVGTVDVSVAGGPWTNLATYIGPATGRIALDMDAYAGANVQLRFHYDDVNSWGWYWHVDDVGLYQPGSSGPGTAYCFGNTAAGNPCPCGNDNDGTDPLGAGCAHDDSAAGARLTASGVASLTGDTLVFQGLRGPISNSSLFFQANNDLDGASVFLGDGLRCAGGGLIRLKVKSTDASGSADSTPMVVTTRSASFGHPITAGETLYYQWWFRDSNGSPCGTESNTSNGYAITWGP